MARKLGNFGSFDPELQQRNVTGLIHSSKLDREIWDEYNANWNQLVLEARRLTKEFESSEPDAVELEVLIVEPTGPSERDARTRARLHQSFFRQAILSSYEETCCITGLRISECLVASHIIPWATDEDRRTDPRNGLCLSATFDSLFDRGLLAISEDLHAIIADALLKSKNKETAEMICTFHSKPIIRPHQFLPSADGLEWHRNNIFQG